MEHFPSSFQAQKVQNDVVANQIKKIEQDLKILRKKIVKSFHGSVHYHSEVSHEMLSDLSEEEQKNFYCMVKDELQQRGFVVRGKISGKTLSLIMFSNAPRTNEMDKILKSYSEDHQNNETSDKGSRSSTPEGKKVSSVPNSPSIVKRKSSIPIRKGTNVHKSKKTRSSSIPTLTKKGDIFPRDLLQPKPKQVEPKRPTPDMSRLNGQRSSSSSELLSSTRSVQFKVLTEHSLLPLLPRSQSLSLPLTQSLPQPPQLPQSLTQPQPPTTQSQLPQPPTTQSPPQSPPQPPTQLSNFPDLNMEFILNKLKQANRQK